MEKTFDLDITTMDESSAEIAAALKQAGAQEVTELSERGFTGIEIVFACVLAANALANLIIRLFPLWKCGMVVDARGERVLTKKDCDLPRGTVLLISPDNTQTKFQTPTEGDLTPLIKAFTGSKG